jgi:hypothetical protein
MLMKPFEQELQVAEYKFRIKRAPKDLKEAYKFAKIEEQAREIMQAAFSLLYTRKRSSALDVFMEKTPHENPEELVQDFKIRDAKRRHYSPRKYVAEIVREHRAYLEELDNSARIPPKP